MEKGVLVKNILPNSDITGIFKVDNPVLGQSRNGPYWRLTLSDSSGSVEAKIWHPLSLEFNEILSGILAAVSGHASLYREQIQVALDRFAPLAADSLLELDQKDFLPVSPYNIDEMFAVLKQACEEEFKYRPWRKLILNVFNETAICNPFKTFPAAKSIHHAYVGGLLEHTLSVFNLCRKIADNYPCLDRQTLLAGAFFHDIGKIREFSGGLANDYTDEGKLIGHMLLGLEILAPLLEKSGLESGLRDHLKHLILSHHGEPQYGAARLPQTAEAFALHYADNLDAKLAQINRLFANQEVPSWSAWQNGLDRNLYRAERTPETVKNKKSQPEERPLLF